MLVFFNYPYGSIGVDGKIVYGYLEKYDPTHISWQSWKTHKDSLIQASYNKRILEKMFPGKEFPNLSFTYSEMKFLNWQQMCDLCKAFGITTNRQNRLRYRTLREFIKEYC